MAKRKGSEDVSLRGEFGREMYPNTQLDSHFKYAEYERDGIGGQSYVMGSADHPYGTVDGFHYGLEQTGHRHKASSLGRAARKGGLISED